MYTLKYLVEHSNDTSVNLNGKYVPARPVSYGGIYGFYIRLRNAWAVLIGKADAFTWPEGQ